MHSSLTNQKRDILLSIYYNKYEFWLPTVKSIIEFVCFVVIRSMDMVHAFEVERVQALRFIRKVCNRANTNSSEIPNLINSLLSRVIFGDDIVAEIKNS